MRDLKQKSWSSSSKGTSQKITVKKEILTEWQSDLVIAQFDSLTRKQCQKQFEEQAKQEPMKQTSSVVEEIAEVEQKLKKTKRSKQ